MLCTTLYKVILTYSITYYMLSYRAHLYDVYFV